MPAWHRTTARFSRSSSSGSVRRNAWSPGRRATGKTATGLWATARSEHEDDRPERARNVCVERRRGDACRVRMPRRRAQPVGKHGGGSRSRGRGPRRIRRAVGIRGAQRDVPAGRALDLLRLAPNARVTALRLPHARRGAVGELDGRMPIVRDTQVEPTGNGTERQLSREQQHQRPDHVTSSHGTSTMLAGDPPQWEPDPALPRSRVAASVLRGCPPPGGWGRGLPPRVATSRCISSANMNELGQLRHSGIRGPSRSHTSSARMRPLSVVGATCVDRSLDRTVGPVTSEPLGQ